MPRPTLQVVALLLTALLLGVFCGVLLAPRKETETATPIPNGLNTPVVVRVEQVVSSSSEEADKNSYKGTLRLTILNLSDKPVNIKFPIAGYVYLTDRSGQFLNVPETGDFAKPGTVVIQKGSSATFECGFSVWSNDTPKVLQAGSGTRVRYGLVFDVPDDQDPTDWLKGTVISEPATWTFDLKKKGPP